MHYVIDTHTFLWYLADDSRLSSKARSIFTLSEAGRAVIIIPAVVLLECIDILDKGKVNINFEEIISKIIQSNNFIFSEINWSLILEVNRTKGLKDLHDRVIVATAKVFDASIISKDRIMSKFYQEIIW